MENTRGKTGFACGAACRGGQPLPEVKAFVKRRREEDKRILFRINMPMAPWQKWTRRACLPGNVLSCVGKIAAEGAFAG